MGLLRGESVLKKGTGMNDSLRNIGQMHMLKQKDACMYIYPALVRSRQRCEVTL